MEMEFNIEKYEEELHKYIRSNTVESDKINSLTDDNISYLLTIWDEYLDTLDLDEDEEVFDVDPDEFYSYLHDVMAEDEIDIEIDVDTMIHLIELEEDFVESLCSDE